MEQAQRNRVASEEQASIKGTGKHQRNRVAAEEQASIRGTGKHQRKRPTPEPGRARVWPGCEKIRSVPGSGPGPGRISKKGQH